MAVSMDGVMRVLAERDMTAAEITSIMGCTTTCVNGALRKLVDRGLADRRTVFTDRGVRSQYGLTEAGRRALEHGMPSGRRNITDAEIRRREAEALQRMLDFTPHAGRDDRGLWIRAGACAPWRLTEGEARALMDELREALG